MNEQNIPTTPEQSAPAAPETAAPRTPAEEAVTVGALRGAIERKAQQRARRAAEESAARWSREADELAAQCPDFDLGAALSDAQFCALLRAGVDVRTAWFALHAQALLEAACVRAGRSAEQRVAEHIRARGLRPAENGLGGGGAGIFLAQQPEPCILRADPAALLRRIVGGAIVHQQHLKRLKALPPNAGHRLIQPGPSVVHRYHQADQRGLPRYRRFHLHRADLLSPRPHGHSRAGAPA